MEINRSDELYPGKAIEVKIPAYDAVVLTLI
jgi:hypothetical protein